MKINKCKLCGNEKILTYTSRVSEQGGGYDIKEITCINCGLSIRRSEFNEKVTEEDLINDWNRINDV